MTFIDIDENTILEFKYLSKGNTLCSDKAGYQRIKTTTECKYAAVVLGKPRKVSLMPKELSMYAAPGCFFDKGENTLWFNPVEKGPAAATSKPICERQGNKNYHEM